MHNPRYPTGPAPDRIALARDLAALAPSLPDDDLPARDALAGIAILLGGRWPHKEAAVLGAIRLSETTSSEWLRRLAAGVVCSLHARPIEAPSLERRAEAHGLASLGVLMLADSSPAFPLLCRVCGLLNSPAPDLAAALDLTLQAASLAEPGSPAGTLARAAAMALCAPSPLTVLAEIGKPQ